MKKPSLTTRSTPNLFEYRSYRSYLKDLLAFGKSTSSPPLTLAKFAQKLGLSASSLQMIMDGKRNLTVHKVHQLAASLGLAQIEQEFFDSLVHFEQAETLNERRFFEHRLGWQEPRMLTSIKRISEHELLSEWYLPALLVHALDAPGEPNYLKIEEVLGLSQKKAQQVFLRLQTLGILEKSGNDGTLHIVYDKMASSFPKEQFTLKLIHEVERRVRREFRTEVSYFEAHTLTSCPVRFAELVSEYKSLLSKYIEKGAKSNEPHVYQSFMAFMKIL